MVFKNQSELFKWVWDNRPHFSEISGQRLSESPSPWNFAHVLPKGSFPQYKCSAFNIVLVTMGEHTKFDHQTHKAKADPQFDWLFQYREALTRRYYKQFYPYKKF